MRWVREISVCEVPVYRVGTLNENTVCATCLELLQKDSFGLSQYWRAVRLYIVPPERFSFYFEIPFGVYTWRALQDFVGKKLFTGRAVIEGRAARYRQQGILFIQPLFFRRLLHHIPEYTDRLNRS